MPDAALMALEGAPAVRPYKYIPISNQTFFTGLVTQRSPFSSLDNRYNRRFLGGRPDQLFDGLNVELSNYGTIIRRPGLTAFSTATLPAPVLGFYSFKKLGSPGTSETIIVMADTSTAVYSLTPTAKTLVFTKSSNAGQTTFQGVGSLLFAGNGIDLFKWNGTSTSNWGIVAPVTAPTLSFVSAGLPWVGSHAYNLGDVVVDTNGNKQQVTTAGTSGTSQPTWAVDQASTTPDGAGTLVWTNEGPLGLSPTAGYQYVYAFKNSTTGHVSTASPASATTGPLIGQNIQVGGLRSADAQVDKIEIFRTTDGGATYQFLADIANPVSGTWTFTDTLQDTQLNNLILAPLANSNNPPPAGLTNLAYHAQRIWGAVGNIVYFSGGPDTTTGSGLESFPPANTFAFPSLVNRLVPLSIGLLVFTTSDIYLIAGTSTLTFYPLPYIEGIGLRSYNAIDILGSTISLLTSDSQFLAISASSVSEDGFPIGNLLQQFDPTKAYVSAHVSGTSDKAIFVADGLTSWYRMNPNQMPEGGPAWSPKAAITGGVTAIASLETSPGVHQLLCAQSNGTVLYRDFTNFSDNGTAYSAFVTLGSMVLAQPGQLAVVDSITLELQNVGSVPSLGVLMNEISGSFANLAQSVNDPPDLLPSTTVMSNRFYLSQNPKGNLCRHLQMKVTFAAEAVKNELLTISIYGGLHFRG